MLLGDFFKNYLLRQEFSKKINDKNDILNMTEYENLNSKMRHAVALDYFRPIPIVYLFEATLWATHKAPLWGVFVK
jgi:hypothetical protein